MVMSDFAALSVSSMASGEVRGSSAASASQEAMSDFFADDGDTSSHWKQCFLCRARIPPGEEKIFQHAAFHVKPCWADVRSCRLAAGKDIDVLDEIDKMMISDPPAWREKVAPFRTDRATARKNIAEEIKTRHKKRKMEEVDSNRDIADTMTGTEDEYVTYWQSVNKFLEEAQLRLEFAQRVRDEGNVNPGTSAPVGGSQIFTAFFWPRPEEEHDGEGKLDG